MKATNKIYWASSHPLWTLSWIFWRSIFGKSGQGFGFFGVYLCYSAWVVHDTQFLSHLSVYLCYWAAWVAGASVRGRVDGHRESGSHWLLKTTCNCHPRFQLPLLCVCPHNWTGKYLILQSPQYLRRVALSSLFACKLSVDPFPIMSRQYIFLLQLLSLHIK